MSRSMSAPKTRNNTHKRKRTKKINQEKWIDVKREIRPKFIEAGITSCELGWKGCTGSIYIYLTFAHSLRRRKIDKLDGEEKAKAFREVIRACTTCHKDLDSLEHEQTTRIVRETIKKRIKPVI